MPSPNDDLVIDLKPVQRELFASASRFRVMASGRRSGKTYLAAVESLLVLVDPLHELEGGGAKYPYLRHHGKPRHVAYIAPTYRQAKDVAWVEFKEITRRWWARDPYETELRILLVGGHQVQLYGAENYDRIRGTGLDFATIDEYADIHPDAWAKVIRPALADRQGGALFIGTPRGFNHFHDLFERVPELPDYERFQFTTLDGGLVPLTEVEAARLELDPFTFRQEYLASFEDLMAHRAYYAFSHSNITETVYDSDYPLILAMDFNISPMSWLLCQQYGEGIGGDVVHVLDEIVVRDTNTPAQCKALDERVERLLPAHQHTVRLEVFGDASGATASSSGSPSDIRIVKRHLGNHPLYQASFHIPKGNPYQKDRVAAVNAMLAIIQSGFSQRLFIDRGCGELIADMRKVVWQTDSKGNAMPSLGKKDPDRTHASDALGYYIERRFGLRARIGWKPPSR